MGQFWLNDNIYETGENEAKISSISHSNGPILVGQLRESHAEILRVGRPDNNIKIIHEMCAIGHS